MSADNNETDSGHVAGLAQLVADVEVLTVGASTLDFEVRKDPAGSTESHVGERVSTITSARYLFDLGRFLDWGAGKDAEKASAAPDKSEDRRKFHKYAARARRQAAVCRYFARHLIYKPESPF